MITKMKKKNKKRETEPFTIALIGPTYVGKSQMVNQFLFNEFRIELSTMGSKIHEIEHFVKKDEFFQSITVRIIDTGVCRYFPLLFTGVNQLNGCMIVFSLSERSTFKQIPLYIEAVQNTFPDPVTIIIVGNCTYSKRKVSLEEANEFANSNKCKYFEVSVGTGENVKEVFNYLISISFTEEDIRRYINKNKIVLKKKHKKRKNKCI